MERLTEYHNGVAVIKDKSKHKEAMERLAAYEETGLTPEDIYKIDEAYTQQAKELMEYKDAEEQGLLFRLQCKIGDTIYKIPSKAHYDLNVLQNHEEFNRVYEQEVCKITITDNGKFGLLIGYTTCDGMGMVVSSMFGENWFLNEKEAEAKLKELRGNHGATDYKN